MGTQCDLHAWKGLLFSDQGINPVTDDNESKIFNKSFPHTSPSFFHVKGGINPYTRVRRRRPMRKTKQRPLFSPHQVQTMEKEFDSGKYLTEDKRAQLAVELKLTETQVKTWFQNRRTKWRKELRNEIPPREVPDGRLKSSLEERKRRWDILQHLNITPHWILSKLST